MRQTENVDENVVKTGMNWNILHKIVTWGRGQAGYNSWVRLVGHPSRTEIDILASS